MGLDLHGFRKDLERVQDVCLLHVNYSCHHGKSPIDFALLFAVKSSGTLFVLMDRHFFLFNSHNIKTY